MRAALGVRTLRALGITDRRFGWPLEMVLRAAADGLADHGGDGAVRAPHGSLQGNRHRRGDGTGRTRHGPGAAMIRPWASRPLHVLVMAKAPVPGRVKTRLCPPCTWDQAAAIAEAALADTLAAVVACRATRKVVALDGEPGPWLPPGVEVISQRGHGLRRAAGQCLGGHGAADRRAGGSRSAWIRPQVTASLLDDQLAMLSAGRDVGEVRLGGYSERRLTAAGG